MRSELIFVLLSLFITAGCSSNTTQPPTTMQIAPSPANAVSPALSSPPSQPAPPEAALVKASVDACALLTSKEIEAVQGEPLKESKLTGQSANGFRISQCFFSLPTFSSSISLLVAQKGEGAGARDPKGFWRDTFHEDRDKDRDRERAGEGEKKKPEEEEEAPPQKVSGVGDEAYWVGSRVGGALYALKRNAYVRISIGGPSDQATKIKKSKALAQKALARL